MIENMSGYHLYRSSSLESFPKHIPEIFIADNPLSSPVYIIVQNRGLGEWLYRFLAEQQGGVMGLQILMPEQALRMLVTGFPSARKFIGSDEPKFLFLDGIKLTIYKALNEILETQNEIFSPIRTYLGANTTERIWQLSQALASAFHHYGMNCGPLIDSWTSGKAHPALEKKYHETEEWQKHLWNRIFHPESPYFHLGEILSVILENNDTYDGIEARIVLFGSTFLGERGIRFFQRIATSLDVHHFMLTPSQNTEKPALFFLRNNARLSNGINTLLSTINPQTQTLPQNNPGSEESTLHRLRESLIHDEEFKKPPLSDGSLCFHDVPGIRRSVEILKDRILIALREDPCLAPTQIGVLAPDIGEYAPYIETIFPSLDKHGKAQQDHLPFNIADLNIHSESPFPSALDSLLDIPGSHFGRRGIILLLENPCFAPVARNPSLLPQWKNLIETLNIRRGVDTEHRQNLGAADWKTGSWEQGFHRILTGYFHDEEDNPNILPLPQVSDTLAEESGILMHTILTLKEELHTLDKAKFTLCEWTRFWEKTIDKWLLPRENDKFRTQDEGERLQIKKAFRNMNALSQDIDNFSDFSNAEIPWLVFRNLLKEFRSSLSTKRGRYLSHGVTCGSLKPTRAIPFRRIYVLGLDEGIWPGKDTLTGFDLREKFPRTIDLSRESVDRFALVEVLFSASDHLSLFYKGRDPERGEKLAPATPVQELMMHLGKESETLIIRHPLLPFDPLALTKHGALATTSRKALMLNREWNNPSPPLRHMYSVPLPPLLEKEEIVDWRNLVRFLHNPVEYFFRHRITASHTSKAIEDEEYDLLEINTLDWWQQKHKIIQNDISAIENPQTLVETFCHRNSLESAVCSTPLANFQAERWIEETKILTEQLQRISKEGFVTEPAFACMLSEKEERPNETPQNLLETINTQTNQQTLKLPAVNVPIHAAHPVIIKGNIGGLRFLHRNNQPDPQVWLLVDFISSFTPKTTHNIYSWTAMLLLAVALGNNRPREIRVFRIGKRDYKARRYFFREEDIPEGGGGEQILIPKPRNLLHKLVNLYHQGKQTPLPLYPEMLDELKKTLKSGKKDIPETALEEAWNKIINDTHKPYSAMRNCPWRQHFLPHPSFGNETLKKALTELYAEGGLL